MLEDDNNYSSVSICLQFVGNSSSVQTDTTILLLPADLVCSFHILFSLRLSLFQRDSARRNHFRSPLSLLFHDKTTVPSNKNSVFFLFLWFQVYHCVEFFRTVSQETL